MRIAHNSTAMVVLGAARHAALAMARSLGRLGVPVYVVDDKAGPVCFSRYCRGVFRWNLTRSAVNDSLKFLLELAGKVGGKPILLPASDHAALFVVDHAPVLKAAYVFPNQLPGTSHALVSKQSMFELAVQTGIPTPDTFLPRSRSELLAYADGASFPLVLKVDDGGRTSRSEGKVNTKCIVREFDQLILEYDRMQDPEVPNLIVQEYIPGGEDSIWMFNGYFNEHSECLFGMTGQKIRQSPVYTGAACLAVCVQNQTVQQLTLDFMKSIGYRGILDIGYRYDARDGKYKVLDVNPRIGATFRLFLGSNDMDVARALYLDMTGQPVPTSLPAPDGRKWIVEDCDLVSSWRYYRDGKLTFRDYINSLRGLRELSFISAMDPLPMFSLLAFDIAELTSRIWNSLQPSHPALRTQ